MSTLERAIAIAAEAHSGQVDKAGAPYILHPLRVMLAMKTDQERIVAVLHDLLEDCPPWCPAMLEREGFSREVVDGVVMLTRQPGDTYEYFIRNIVTRSPISRRVKLADLADNMDLSRLATVTDRDLSRLERYRRATEALIRLDVELTAEGR